MHVKTTVLTVMLACALGASPAFAKHGAKKDKEKFWDGECKVERKWKKDGRYEEKRKCSPGAYSPVEAEPPMVVTLPPALVLRNGY